MVSSKNLSPAILSTQKLPSKNKDSRQAALYGMHERVALSVTRCMERKRCEAHSCNKANANAEMDVESFLPRIPEPKKLEIRYGCAC